MSDDPVAHRGPRPTTAGSSSRSTSSTGTRRRTSTRCGSRGIEAAGADARGRSRPRRRADAVVIAPSNPIVSIGPILGGPRASARRSPRRVPGACRWRRSAASSAARRSRARRTGCSPRSATSRAPLGVARLYAGSSTSSSSTTSTRTLAADVAALGLRVHRHRHDHGATTPAGPGSRARSWRLAGARPWRDARPRAGRRASIPVGALDGAKSRLGAVLDAEERRDLVDAPRCGDHRAPRSRRPAIAETLVVSPDPRSWPSPWRPAPGRCASVRTASTPALRQAREDAAAGGAGCSSSRSTCPRSRRRRSRRSLAARRRARGRRSVGLVPDRHGRGTNALLLDPPDAIDPAFGGDSRAAHARPPSSAGAPFVELDGPLTATSTRPTTCSSPEALRRRGDPCR